MKALNIKVFFKELLLHCVFFFVLTLIYLVMLAYPALERIGTMLYDFIFVLPVFIAWMCYCTFFFHVVFRVYTEQKSKKKALRNFLILLLSIFIVDKLSFYRQIYAKTVTGWELVPDLTFIFRTILFTAYAFFYSFIRGYIKQREQRLKAEKEQVAASLKNLRSQIEPHFIFNTLNNIYAFSLEEKATKTASSIEELAGLFRYTLKESKAEKVPVAAELEFIEKYIHLHSIRLEENKNIELHSNITWDKKPAAIAPLLIISFIENAFKYGISLQEPSQITIHAEVRDATIHLNVKNTVHENNKAIQNGFGLDNTRKRLEILYAGKYSLNEKRQNNIYEIELNINLS